MPRGCYQRPEPAPASFSGLVTQARAVGEARQAKAEGVEGAGPALRGALLDLATVATDLAGRGQS